MKNGYRYRWVIIDWSAESARVACIVHWGACWLMRYVPYNAPRVICRRQGDLWVHHIVGCCLPHLYSKDEAAPRSDVSLVLGVRPSRWLISPLTCYPSRLWLTVWPELFSVYWIADLVALADYPPTLTDVHSAVTWLPRYIVCLERYGQESSDYYIYI